MDLILDAPWWIPSLLAVVGIALAISGNRKVDRGLRNVGLGIVGAAVIIVLLTLFVDTPKKIARRQSKELVRAVVAGDWARFESLLEPNAALQVLGVSASYSNARQLTAAARAGVERVHLRDAHIRSLQVTQTGPLVTATLELLTEQDEPSPLIASSWQFDFERTRGGWLIHLIQALHIGDMTEGQIHRELPPAK